MIHGAIDGFSRLITFLKASNNNRKETVLQQFLTASGTYGLPSRIRVDNGGENNEIVQLMELLRGSDRGSAIRGRSVHNQRIERSWVDMWHGATNLFYDVFHFLESRGSLNVDDPDHIWSLHYVYLPRLNRELETFTQQWNNHGLRTEGSQTPLQLFVGHSLELANTQLTAMRGMFGPAEPEVLGEALPQPGNDEPPADPIDPPSADEVDIDIPVPDMAAERLQWNEGVNAVGVPDTACPLSQQALALLQETVDPLENSTELGMDLYLRVLEFLAENEA